MSLTVHVDENPSIRLTGQVVETHPPDRVEFAAEGVIRMTETLLSEFEGRSLVPVGVVFEVDDSRTVETDLAGEASLRIETVDVGVETPDADDLSPGMETVSSATDDEPAGSIAFTVEGVISSVPPETLDRIAGGASTLKSVTFAVEDAVRSDGGSGGDVVFEFGVLGRRVVVHRNGTVDVGRTGGDLL